MSKEPELQFVRLSHPREHQYFDSGTIRIVERYKTSGLSGDEWRFSCVVELSRKGKVVATRAVGEDLIVAATQLQWGLHLGPGELESEPGWEVVPADRGHYADDGQCCQPGCPNAGVHVYVLKEVQLSLSDSRMVPNVPQYKGGQIHARRFCDRHKRRGDCALDDSDGNYEERMPDRRGKTSDA